MLMKDREPFELKKILLVYNFSQVLFSLWMFLEGWGFYISGNYSWHCEPVDYSESPVARRALNLAWWYYFSKFIDLFDSVFFVLKKKFAHLDVPLLPAGRLRTRPEALPLVEEVPHHHPAGAVRHGLLPRPPAADIHLRLSSGSVVDVRGHRGSVLHPLHGLLQTGLLEEEVGGEGGQERQLRPGDGERAGGQRAHEHPRQRRGDGHQATQVGLNRLYQHYCMEEHSLEALTTMTVFEYL